MSHAFSHSNWIIVLLFFTLEVENALYSTNAGPFSGIWFARFSPCQLLVFLLSSWSFAEKKKGFSFSEFQLNIVFLF
jgi:hypothetical protein